jgi:hypothetical protein
MKLWVVTGEIVGIYRFCGFFIERGVACGAWRITAIPLGMILYFLTAKYAKYAEEDLGCDLG